MKKGNMGSVIVKGMEMPESCYRCPMANDDFYLCGATEKYLEYDSEERRPDWCPLIEAEGRMCDSCKHNDFPDGDGACLACCEYYDCQYKEKLL